VPQPEVARLLFLVLALLVVVPTVVAGHALALASALLVEFLTDGRPAPLSMVSAESRRTPLGLDAGPADRYRAPALRPAIPLVLVHGFVPAGKDDPRVVRAAGLLARAGFDVAVPSIPGLRQGRLRPEDVEPVVAAVAAVARDDARRAVLVGVSVGAGPALLAAADPRIRDAVGAVLSLGGYASALELLRFFLTGDFAWGQVRGHVEHDPEVVQLFIRANADLVDDATRRGLLARDAARIAALLAAPPPELGRLLQALSPERVARDIRARLVLVHGRGDRAVPYTESLRLAAARPEATRIVLVGLFDHLEGAGSGLGWRHGLDVLSLLGTTYALVAGGDSGQGDWKPSLPR
jgi:hypothetical protein